MTVSPPSARLALASFALALAGCATLVFNAATNAPMTNDTPPMMDAQFETNQENIIAVSFSGGGLRAAAFAHGVLRALAETKTPDGDLLDDLGLISSVSGGSLTAAYFGLHGREGVDHFREDVLLHDFERHLRMSVFLPANLSRILGGGLNAREDFGDWLDREVFHGATFADIYHRAKPEIRIHATDLYHRVPFPFIPRVFSILCSDIRSYSVADAVAASMAVPVVFAPVVLRTYPDRCNEPLPEMLVRVRNDPNAPRLLKASEQALSAYRNPQLVRYIKLVDGGLTDNLGLSTLIISRAIRGTPYAPLSERDAVKIRRLLFIVVDAARGPRGDWSLQAEGPRGVDVALGATDAAVDSSARLAADAFEHMMREWQEAVIGFRCGLRPEDVARLAGPPGWRCADVKFSLVFLSIDSLAQPHRARIDAVPTRLTLDAAQIDATIEGARQGTLALPQLQEYLRDRRVTERPPLDRRLRERPMERWTSASDE